MQWNSNLFISLSELYIRPTMHILTAIITTINLKTIPLPIEVTDAIPIL